MKPPPHCPPLRGISPEKLAKTTIQITHMTRRMTCLLPRFSGQPGPEVCPPMQVTLAAVMGKRQGTSPRRVGGYRLLGFALHPRTMVSLCLFDSDTYMDIDSGPQMEGARQNLSLRAPETNLNSRLMTCWPSPHQSQNRSYFFGLDSGGTIPLAR